MRPDKQELINMLSITDEAELQSYINVPTRLRKPM
jgi:hypothetical protein